MNETQHTEAEKLREGGTTNFIELLIILAKHKKAIIIVPVFSAVIALALSFALPDVYKANAKLLPPQQPQSGAAAILSQLGGVANVVAGGAGPKNPNELYIAMLKSRTVADKLIQRFSLDKVFATESPEKTRQKLEASTTIATGKDGLINIDFESENIKLVADVANAYVEELVILTKELAVTEAGQRRKFFELQLTQSKDRLTAAEISLKQGLQTRGVVSVDTESRVIVETMGRLRAQIAAKEIQIRAMQAFVTANNQEYKRANEELKSLRSELSKLETGGGPVTVETALKEDALDNIKLLREVKYYQMLYELLAKQYEAARLDEAKEASVIQVLDSAIQPERKFKPKRMVLVLAATLAGLFFAVLWAFIAEMKKSVMRSPERSAQLARLGRYLRSQ